MTFAVGPEDVLNVYQTF